MIKTVLSVLDSAAQVYGQPFYVPAIAAGVRLLRDEVNRPDKDNNLYQHPEDFTLYHLADFDDVTGQFHPKAPVIQVVRCKDLVDPDAGKPG